jgi:hypothetical protein
VESAYQISLSGTDALFGDGLNADSVQRQVNFVDAVLLTKDRHQLKFGFDYRRLFPLYHPVKYAQAYFFNGAVGALAGTAPSIFVGAFLASNGSPHATNFSAYAQDAWTTSSRLTLTMADPAAVALAPPGTPMYRTTFNNVAPRVGGAYQLRGAPGREMVVRGGWGVFFDLGSGPVMDNFVSFPFVARRTLTSVPFLVDPALLTPPIIVQGAPADPLIAADPNLKLPYTHQWNVTIEQTLGATSTMSVSYVGALGRRQLREETLLNPSPEFQTLILVTKHGHSRYDALQVKSKTARRLGLTRTQLYVRLRRYGLEHAEAM